MHQPTCPTPFLSLSLSSSLFFFCSSSSFSFSASTRFPTSLPWSSQLSSWPWLFVFVAQRLQRNYRGVEGSSLFLRSSSSGGLLLRPCSGSLTRQPLLPRDIYQHPRWRHNLAGFSSKVDESSNAANVPFSSSFLSLSLSLSLSFFAHKHFHRSRFY